MGDGSEGQSSNDGSDGTSGDAAVLAGEVARADEYLVELECRCFWQEDGFADEQACIADARYSDEELRCFMNAVSGDASAAAALECELDALEQSASCYESAGCDEAALDACVMAENAAYESCPELDAATDSEVDACFD